MSDDFERKYKKAIEELESTSISRSNYLPPAHRLLGKLGFNVRPPHYNSFLSNAIPAGIFFGTAWGMLMWIFLWGRTDLSIPAAITTSISAGVLFGVVMGAYYLFSSNVHSLSSWDEL